MLASPPADADPAPIPIVLRNKANGGVRVRVAAGIVAPCDSSSDTPMYSAKLEPGAVVNLALWDGECICVEHTQPPFTEVDWMSGRIFCMPKVCWHRQCRPASDPTIRVDLPFAN